MLCNIITLFPEMFENITKYGMLKKALDKNILKINYFNPRNFTDDPYNSVDDKPYGGGPGMVMSVLPLKKALLKAKENHNNYYKQKSLNLDENIKLNESYENIKTNKDKNSHKDTHKNTHKNANNLQNTKINNINIKNCSSLDKNGKMRTKVIFMSPEGAFLKQSKLTNLVDEKINPILIAGRYEGVDERFIEKYVDEVWSIGNYVLSGGELAIMVVLDALARLMPGVLGNAGSMQKDSFMDGLLDHPHYTKPKEIDGLQVPDILLSGDHKKISKWRLKQQLGRTWLYKRNLLNKISLTNQQKELLKEFLLEIGEKNE